MMKAYLIDLGRMNYTHAHRFQVDCVQWRLADRGRPDIFLVVEHPPVFTLGSRGGRESFMVGEDFVRNRGVDIVQTERGGDITYHGPGQLVVYPIVHLRESRFTVRGFVDKLEEVMIACSGDFGVEAGRDDRNRGIWVGNNKIGSVGIRVRHGISFHGLALNVNLDFEHFSWIQPCGLSGVGVTSLARESKTSVDFNEVKEQFILNLGQTFDRQFVSVGPAVITGEAV
ncbi:MAG: lipoyl(octanoyl) transferase LipB [Desulforhopalus sp.]